MKVTNTCSICGQLEEKHHKFLGMTQPDRCICDPLEWDAPMIPPVCDAFANAFGGDRCTRCEHDLGCHK
jgi:hypothetical protein